jgi:CRISPR/Cas system endoribonuclease Cas6 (RAMP superfamily)
VDKEELHWLDLKRYSRRQRKKIPLGGLVGRVYLNNVSSWWLKWWQLASLVHVGKGAGMGLGKIVY